MVKRPPSLTERAAEVLRLKGEGLSHQQIAKRLQIAPSTVANHLGNAYAVLGVGNCMEAVAKAARMGITSISPNEVEANK